MTSLARAAHALRAVAAASLTLVLLATAGLAGPASAHSPDPIMGGGLFDQDQVLQFRWGAGGTTPPVAARTAVLDAVAGSNATRLSKAPTFRLDAGAESAIAYGGSVPCGVNGIACMRRNVSADSFGVWFRPHGHRFDWGTLRWCQLQDPVTNGCFDMENITLDELGHVLVLDHHVNLATQADYEDAVVQTVSRARPKAGWNAHAYGRCDVATLQRQYDVLTWATPYSTCLDIPTTLALGASAGTVAYGTTATFTATLRTADGYGRLSLNPMDGRTVVLQRRASASTWTDMAVMKPAGKSGVYSAAQVLLSTGDWRAVFRKPSTEGVRSSTSSTVKVSVSGSCTTAPCPLSLPGRGER
jgi:hypothetical protein